MAAPRICCCDPACWVKIRQCCGEFSDQVYVPCAIAKEAGIPLTGAFLWSENCWEVETIIGTPPPAGSLVIGEEIVGAIRATYDHCQEEFPGDPDACCHSRVKGCWYYATQCCSVTAPACDGQPQPPAIVYIDCTVIDEFVEAGSLSFPFTFKPLDLVPGVPEQCVPCFTMNGDSVEELPPDATVLANIDNALPFPTCEDVMCCPSPPGELCPLPCSQPTHAILDFTPICEVGSDCDCDLPLNPQAWLMPGPGENNTLGCSAATATAVSMNGCKLTYVLSLACNLVLDGNGDAIAIFYRISLLGSCASTLGPLDPDCVICGFTLPGVQTCVDPCGDGYGFTIRTPNLPLGTCPSGSQFTIVEATNNIIGTPSVAGFI